jgi:hypothetical protein
MNVLVGTGGFEPPTSCSQVRIEGNREIQAQSDFAEIPIL